MRSGSRTTAVLAALASVTLLSGCSLLPGASVGTEPDSGDIPTALVVDGSGYEEPREPELVSRAAN